MAIADDFTIHPASKVIRHGSGTTVYSVVAFYSWIMDTFDEPGYMSYQTPMKYNTPTSYTMLNGWFLDNGDGSNILEYLTGGSIDTSGYATIDDPVYVLDVDTITQDFVSGDKGKDIEDDATAVGPLLAYVNNYGGTADHNRAWVRDTRGTPAAIADSSAITVDGGTGAATANGSSISGDEVYANIYTIASFVGTPDPQVYIFQVHPDTGVSTRISEWSAFTNWDRGTIDVLIPVKLGGAAIDTGNLTVFVRQPGDTFTHTEATVSTTEGTRTPVATETAADTVNITKGEHYMFYDGGTSPSISAGNVIQDVATDSGTVPTWYAEVVTHTSWNAATGLLIIRGLRGSPADADNIYVGTSDTTANVNGTVGDTYVTYDAETTGPVAGDLGKPFEGGTSGAHRVLRSYQDDGTSGKLLFQVYHTHGALDGQTYTGSGRDVLYTDFADNDVVDAPSGGSGAMDVTLDSDSTTLISGYSDVSIVHINGTCTGSGGSGTFTPGERVTWNAGSSSAYVVKASGSSITLANVDSGDEPDAADTFTGDISGATLDCDSGLTDDNTETFAFNLQTAYDYTVFVECGSIYNTGRDLDDVYAYLQYKCRDGETNVFYTSDGSSITEIQGQAYIKAAAAYSANKNAPFGSLAGGVLFGARGVWVQGMASSDNNNIKLTDHNSNLREPYISVDVTVSNTRVGDDIAVYLESGTTGLPDKDQYTGHATNNVQSGSTFDQDAAGGGFPNDTPISGTFTVVATDENEEHRYRYDSWANDGGSGDDGRFTLAAEVTGTAEGGSTGTTLIDTGVFATGVQRGDIIRNATDASWGYILSVDSDDQVTTTIMRDSSGTAVPWQTSDTFEINSLIQAYDGSDEFFVPYMDTIESTGTEGSPGSETVSLTYVSERPVLIRVRNVSGVTPIQPFVTTSDITNGGMTVAVIRNPDDVYA